MMCLYTIRLRSLICTESFMKSVNVHSKITWVHDSQEGYFLNTTKKKQQENYNIEGFLEEIVYFGLDEKTDSIDIITYENDLPVILLDSIIDDSGFNDLKKITHGLKNYDAEPDAWNLNQWHSEDYHLTPEMDDEGDPIWTATGAALWLYENYPVM